jgi:hypothetical protein
LSSPLLSLIGVSASDAVIARILAGFAVLLMFSGAPTINYFFSNWFLKNEGVRVLIDKAGNHNEIENP